MTDHKDYATLYRISRAVNSSLNLPEVLQLILDTALNAVGAAIGWISVREGDYLHLQAVRGVDRHLVKKTMVLGEGITGTVAQTGKTFYAQDVASVANYYKVDSAIRSELALPLLAFGDVVGVLNIELVKIDGLSEADRELLSDFAAEAGSAVKNALQFGEASGAQERLTAELAEKVRSLEAVGEISRAVSSSLELAEVLDIIMHRVAEHVPAGFCQLLLYDADSDMLHIYEPRNTTKKIWRYSHVRPGEGISGWVAQHRTPLLIADVAQDHRYVPFFDETKAEMAVPLVKDDRLIGVINMESFQLNAFTQKHLKWVMLLANHAVIAIENARLYDNLKKTRDQVVLNERLATVGEVASDLLHWVANKVGIIPRAVENARAESPEAATILDTYLEMMDRNARTVLSLKKEMLGKRESLILESLALLPLVTSVTEELDVRAPLQLRITCLQNNIKVKADHAQLVKVVQYLVENGLDSMTDQSDGTLVVQIQQRGKRVMIEVVDTGCGISQEHISQVFNSFFTTKQAGASTGMGLWFAYRAMQKMDGSIEVVSELGEGTTFRIYLPMA